MLNQFSEALKKAEEALSNSGIAIVGIRNIGFEDNYHAPASEPKKAIWIDVTVNIPIQDEPNRA